MTKKKLVKNIPAFVEASSCLLQSISPQIFGQVLRFLRIRELGKIDLAICDCNLRLYWWVGAVNLKKRPRLLDVCMRYAIDPCTLISWYSFLGDSDQFIQWLLKRQVVFSGLKIHPERTSVAIFRKLLASPLLQLNSLNVAYLYTSVKFISYLQAIRSLRHLRVLTIESDVFPKRYPTTAGATIIANNPHLESLSLYCSAIDIFLPHLHEARALRHLELIQFTHITEYLSTDAILKFLLPLRPQLESFSMPDISILLAPVMHGFLNGFTFPALRNVNINSIRFHGDMMTNCVTALASGCPLLETLDISEQNSGGGGQVTEAAVILLAKRCSRLRNINLFSQRAITVEAVEALLSYCPDVREINLRCTGVRTEDLSDLPSMKGFEMQFDPYDYSTLTKVVRSLLIGGV